MSLKDCCKCATNNQNDDDSFFVGIRFRKGNPEVQFPLGYFSDAELREISEENLRKEILTLFEILSDATLIKNDENSEINFENLNEENETFPFQAYRNVLRNFLEFGYYKEREVIYKQGAHGKIHWGRTIKMTRPIVSGKNLIYLKPIARKVSYNENELITQIHKFCVHDAFEKIGFLYSISETENSYLTFDEELFTAVLNEKISKTFNDRDLQLFYDLQKIVAYLAGKFKSGKMQTDFTFGVKKFHTIWENLIDKILGNLNVGEDKSEFNPNCGWELENKQKYNENKKYAMRPDTLMRYLNENGNYLFIVDSKFYQYGFTQNTNDLPSSGSITKQIAYAKFAEIHHKVKCENPNDAGNRIYNIFILPYNANDDYFANFSKENFQNSFYKIKSIGYAKTDWVNLDERPYHKIYSFLFDLKAVMHRYQKSEETQKEIAENVIKLG